MNCTAAPITTRRSSASYPTQAAASVRLSTTRTPWLSVRCVATAAAVARSGSHKMVTTVSPESPSGSRYLIQIGDVPVNAPAFT